MINLVAGIILVTLLGVLLLAMRFGTYREDD